MLCFLCCVPRLKEMVRRYKFEPEGSMFATKTGFFKDQRHAKEIPEEVVKATERIQAMTEDMEIVTQWSSKGQRSRGDTCTFKGMFWFHPLKLVLHFDLLRTFTLRNIHHEHHVMAKKCNVRNEDRSLQGPATRKGNPRGILQGNERIQARKESSY